MRSLKIPAVPGGSTGAVHQRPYLRASTAEVRRLHFPSSWQSSSRRRPTHDRRQPFFPVLCISKYKPLSHPK